eukprot:366432_1
MKSNKFVVESSIYDSLSLPSHFLGLGGVLVHCLLALSGDNPLKKVSKIHVEAALRHLGYQYSYNYTYMCKQAQKFFDENKDKSVFKEPQNIIIKYGNHVNQSFSFATKEIYNFFSNTFITTQS